MKIAYLGCDLFYGCFYDLLNKHKIIKLFTFISNEAYEESDKICNSAMLNNIPIKYEKITREELVSLFQNDGCELLISAGYPYKIPVKNDDKFRCINIHPSLLPNGKGNWPLPFAILREEKYWGVTIHKLNEKFDEGDILVQKKFRLKKSETTDSLLEKCSSNARFLLLKYLRKRDYYFFNALPQGKGEYLKLTEDLLTITDKTSIADAKKIIRAAGKIGATIKKS